MVAILLWVVCALLELPNYFNWGGHTFDPKTMACSYDRTANYSYTVFFVLVAIGPPLVVVLICYSNIFAQVSALWVLNTIYMIGATSTNPSFLTLKLFKSVQESQGIKLFSMHSFLFVSRYVLN